MDNRIGPAQAEQLLRQICLKHLCAYCIPQLALSDPAIACQMQQTKNVPIVFLADGQCTTAAKTDDGQVNVKDDKTPVTPGIMAKNGFLPHRGISVTVYQHKDSVRPKDDTGVVDFYPDYLPQ